MRAGEVMAREHASWSQDQASGAQEPMAQNIAGEADYIVVGAGSAGCVLANRLTEDGKTQVILLEAGGDDRPLHEPRQFMSNMNIHIPAGFTSMLGDPKIN